MTTDVLVPAAGPARWRRRHHAAFMAFAVITFVIGCVAVGALVLGGGYPYGSRAAAERNTLQIATAVGIVCSLVLIANTVRRELSPAVRVLALLAAALPLLVPALWAAQHEPTPAVADSFGCGSITSPSNSDEPGVLGQACRTALARQRNIALSLGVLPIGVIVAAAAAALKDRETDDQG
jgi:small-conductance mechanosensitive channel